MPQYLRFSIDVLSIVLALYLLYVILAAPFKVKDAEDAYALRLITWALAAFILIVLVCMANTPSAVWGGELPIYITAIVFTVNVLYGLYSVVVIKIRESHGNA